MAGRFPPEWINPGRNLFELMLSKNYSEIVFAKKSNYFLLAYFFK
jgi:hypothetical protein